MAVTNADPVPTRKWADIGRKTGVVLISFSILLGLLSFFLCLVAESTRSQLIREMSDGSGGEDSYKRDCTFTNNGRTPFLCATGAFVSLAIVMILLFRPLLSYLSISGLDPSRFMTYVPHDNDNPGTLKASLLFDIIWFLILGAECMLLEGLNNESDHIKEWPISETDYYCVETRKGVFAVAGIIGITMVFLASRLSMTALEAQWLSQDQEIVRQQAKEASIL